MTFKRTSVSFVLALLVSSAVVLAAPVSAQTPQRSATEHHIASPTTTHPVHRARVRKKMVRRPVRRVTARHTVPKPSNHHPMD